MTVGPATASAATTFLSQFGSFGNAPGQFDTPRGIDTTPAGNIVVADQFNDRIQTLAPDGTPISSFGSTGVGQDEFDSPTGVAVLPNGNLAVSDSVNDRVKIVQADGTFVTSFGDGVDPNPTTRPRGIAYDPLQNNILIAESAGNEVQRRALDGSFIANYPTPGATPNAIAVQADGDFLVAEFALDRVEEFSPDGISKSTIGSPGNGPGQFNQPTGIDLAPNGDLWVADSANARIQRLSPAGAPLEQLGAPGSAPGEFSSPRTLATDRCGNVWVTDTQNHRIQRMGEPGTPLVCTDRTLTVTTSGRGSGTVTGNGIDCGGGPTHSDCTETLLTGRSITLTAAPTAGSSFVTFGGGGCSTTNPCTVTLDADRTIGANFRLANDPVVVTIDGPRSTRDRTPEFSFSATAASAAQQARLTLYCRIDRGPYEACSSPLVTRELKARDGKGRRHRVRVRALDNDEVKVGQAKHVFRVVK